MVDTRFSVCVQIMMSLAYHSDEMMNSDILAAALKTNPTFVRKLISKLVEAKLVKSFRGKGGGVKLAKSPDSISLNQIYVAATDDKALISSHNKTPLKACPVSCCIQNVLNEIVNDIEDSTQKYLAGKSLTDLMKKVK